MLFFLTPLRPLAFLRAFSCFLALVLLSACGSVPVSSLWKLRQLQLDTLDPAALRATAELLRQQIRMRDVARAGQNDALSFGRGAGDEEWA